jgi:hypothetical protein
MAHLEMNDLMPSSSYAWNFFDFPDVLNIHGPCLFHSCMNVVAVSHLIVASSFGIEGAA